MKKILVLSALLMFAMGATAFAADLANNAVSNEGAEIQADSITLCKLSANVSAVFRLDATSGTTYALATKATKGSKIYGTAADDTTLYSKNGTVNTALATGDISANTSAEFDSGWTAM